MAMAVEGPLGACRLGAKVGMLTAGCLWRRVVVVGDAEMREVVGRCYEQGVHVQKGRTVVSSRGCRAGMAM